MKKMTKIDIKKLAKLMQLLSEEYGKAVSPLKAELWYNELKIYPIEVIEKSIRYIIRTRTLSTYPKVAEVIKAIENNNEDTVLEKWLLVKKIMKEVGAYRSVKFADPVLHSVIEELGGWPDLCIKDDLTWVQKDFERLYPVIKKRCNHPDKILGLHEISNREHNYKCLPEDTKQIGFNNKKLIVKTK